MKNKMFGLSLKDYNYSLLTNVLKLIEKSKIKNDLEMFGKGLDELDKLIKNNKASVNDLNLVIQNKDLRNNKFVYYFCERYNKHKRIIHSMCLIREYDLIADLVRRYPEYKDDAKHIIICTISEEGLFYLD